MVRLGAVWRGILVSLALASASTLMVGAGASATGFAGGSGTASDPYQIATAAQLQAMATTVNTYAGVDDDFELTANINMTGTSWTTPLDFGGAFNGNGFTIENLGNSLFGTVYASGSVTNVAISGTATPVYSGAFTGILAGTIDGTVSDVFTTGSVTGGGEAGGVIGAYEDDTATATDLQSNATVSASSGANDVGGLVGSEYGGISDSVATGSVTGPSSADVGGFAGVQDKGPATDSLAYGTASSGYGFTQGQLICANSNTYFNRSTNTMAEGTSCTGAALALGVSGSNFPSQGQWSSMASGMVEAPSSMPAPAGIHSIVVDHAADGSTTPALASGTQWQPYSLSESVLSGSPTWYASGLPAGLSIGASTGTISGTPTASGTFTVTIIAYDPSTGVVLGSGRYSLAITAAAASTPPAPPAPVSIPLLNTLPATTFPFLGSFTYATKGTLAVGLWVPAAELPTGDTTTAAGLSTEPADILTFSTKPSIPSDCTASDAVSVQMPTPAPTGASVFLVKDSSMTICAVYQMEPGDTLQAMPSATITGDVAAWSVSADSSFVIYGVPVPTLTLPRGSARYGTLQASTILASAGDGPEVLNESAQGGMPPYTYSLVAHDVPWLTIDPRTGTVSGICDVVYSDCDALPHTYFGVVGHFTVQVTDAYGNTASAIYLVAENPTYFAIKPHLPDGQAFQTYHAALSFTGQVPGNVVCGIFGTGGPPPGITLDPASCVLTGRPTVAGVYHFQVVASEVGLPINNTAAAVTLDVKW